MHIIAIPAPSISIVKTPSAFIALILRQSYPIHANRIRFKPSQPNQVRQTLMQQTI